MKRMLCLIIVGLLCITACGQKVTEVPQDNAPTWQAQYDLGIRHLSEGNYEEAIIAFTAAIEIDPKQEAAYIGLADVYIAQGDTGKATEVLQQAIEAVGEIEALTTALAELKQEPEPEPEEEAEEGASTDETGIIEALDVSNVICKYAPGDYGTGGIRWEVTVDGPMNVADAFFYGGGRGSYPEFDIEDLDAAAKEYKELGFAKSQIEIPFRIEQSLPASSGDLESVLNAVLVGIDADGNVVAYTIVTGAIS